MRRAPAAIPCTKEVISDESKTFRETHLRKVQDYPAQRPCDGNLSKPETQTAPGLIPGKGNTVMEVQLNGSYRWC